MTFKSNYIIFSILISLITHIIFLFIIFPSTQSEFNKFISKMSKISLNKEKQIFIENYLETQSKIGIPIIDKNTAHFLFYGVADTVSIAGDCNGWNPSNSLFTRIDNTKLFYRSEKFEKSARLDYKIVINNSHWILDPENPNLAPGGFGPNSELSMSEYIQPSEIVYDSSISHGKIIDLKFYSRLLGRIYKLDIYLPPGYDSLAPKGYPTIYFQDGSDYISLGSSINIIDNLINENRIQKIISVFVTPTNRMEEFGGNKRTEYSNFFSIELVPHIDSLFNTVKNKSQRLILGTSLGANISAYISYNYPEVFGNCGLHSAAFWVNDNEVYNLFVNGKIKSIRFVATWGTYESLYENMRSFAHAISKKGYIIDYLELPEGHSWGQWRATTDFILETIFPYNK